MTGPERWVLTIAIALAAACPAAVALVGTASTWVIALTFLGTFAAAVAGRLGLSKPADIRELNKLEPVLPLSSRRLP